VGGGDGLEEAAAVLGRVLALELAEDELDFGQQRNHEEAAQDTL
jgi:hypothetical protein